MNFQSPNFAPPIPFALEQTLLCLLQQHDSLKEHELMQQLEQQGYPEFAPSLEPLALFQAHFLLFHILYRLQDKWQTEQLGELSIFTLEIKLHPFQNAPKQPGLVDLSTENLAAPSLTDPIKSYYLDYATYHATQEQDVIELLAQFWQSLGTQANEPSMQQALNTLELSLPLSLKTLNQQYRLLANQHHPDKGGDTQKFQAINQAVRFLRQNLKHNTIIKDSL